MAGRLPGWADRRYAPGSAHHPPRRVPPRSPVGHRRVPAHCPPGSRRAARAGPHPITREAAGLALITRLRACAPTRDSAQWFASSAKWPLRSNSAVVCVTSVRPRRLACAAMYRSLARIGAADRVPRHRKPECGVVDHGESAPGPRRSTAWQRGSGAGTRQRYLSFWSIARAFALAGSSSTAREYALRASSRLFARL